MSSVNVLDVPPNEVIKAPAIEKAVEPYQSLIAAIHPFELLMDETREALRHIVGDPSKMATEISAAIDKFEEGDSYQRLKDAIRGIRAVHKTVSE